MKQKQTEIPPVISSKFHLGVRWSLAGSIIYEVTKAIHNFFLFSLLSNTTYGFLGSTFSLIYFACKIADFGAATSLPPFFNYFVRNRQTFRKILLKHYFLPHFPFVIGTAVIVTYMYGEKFTPPASSFFLCAIVIIIILETIRYFLRIFLHAAFKSKQVVIIEVVLFFLFLSLVWTPYYLFHQPLTIKTIVIAHIIDSLLCVIFFITVLLRFYYRTLPSTNEYPTRPSIKRMTITKMLNYSLRLSRDIFSSNFLTPLFAIKCGLGQAGIFYFATVLVSTLQSTIKMSIHYPSNALLSNIKEGSYQAKKEAFVLMCRKLVKLITPIIIFITINYQFILNLGHQSSIAGSTLAITVVFLLITIIDLFFILYEQFYIIEETSAQLLAIKALECILFYFLVITNQTTSTITLLFTIAAIKLLSFTTTALNAYVKWKLVPYVKVSSNVIVGWFLLSLLFSLFF